MPIVRPLDRNLEGKPWYTILKAAASPRKWELLRDYELYVEKLKLHFLVPAPFVMNFASTPRVFWPIMSPTGILLAGSVFHDFGYQYGGLFLKIKDGEYWQFEKFDREYIDSLLDIITCQVHIIGDNINPVIRGLAKSAYGMVRVFGIIPWNNYRKENWSVRADYAQLVSSGKNRLQALCTGCPYLAEINRFSYEEN